jgi:light-regulated signal transduction histidine kinase (bacteriophytochrome)
MEVLINALLAYARAGTGPKDSKLTNFGEVVECAATNLQVEMGESRAIVTHDPLPTVLADHIQIIQLFQNLIGNSIKFRREEPPRVHVSAEQRVKEWIFSICDNGIGIDPKQVSSIFDIFHRLQSSSEYPGNGIGLAICKKIVKKHGGRIWVESKPMEGSRFYFTIPVKDSTST